MSNDLSNMRAPGRPDQIRRKATDGPLLYIVFGAAVLVAAIVGGLVVYFAASGSQNRAAAPVAAQAAGNQAANQPAQPQVTWKTTGTFGNWLVQCQEQNAKTCRALLQVLKDKQVIMAWVVGAD